MHSADCDNGEHYLLGGVRKEGYHIDEIYSYGLANSYYNPFPFFEDEDYFMHWHDAQYLRDYITVSDEHTFAYDSVYDNQTRDVHPFLYYAVLHTVCSFFPGTFSKWYGLSVNIVFSALVLVVLYGLARRLLSDKEALLACAVYGLSAGAVSNAVYLRMYVMLTFFVAAFTYLHVRLYLKPEDRIKRNYTGIFILTVLGALTQYYFYVFAFFMSAFYCLFLLLRKQGRRLAGYCMVMACAVAAAVGIYPSTLDHVFVGYRGTEAVNNLFHESFLGKASVFFTFVHLEVFGGYFKEILGIVLLMVIILFARRTVTVGKEQDAVTLDIHVHHILRFTNKSYAVSTILISVLAYFALIAQITTIVANRYLFPIYPFVILLVFAGFRLLANLLPVHDGTYILCIVVLWCGITIQEYRKGYVDYLYAGYGAIKNEMASFQDKDVLYISDDAYPIYRDLIFLEEAGRFLPIPYTDFDRQLEKILPEIENREDGMVVYVFKEHEPQAVFDVLQGQLGYADFDLIAETYQSKVYLCQ